MQDNTNQRMPGITCPNCRNLIMVSIDMLLLQEAIYCPACQLRLSIDKQQSDKAIKALNKVRQAQDNLQRKSRFNG